MSVDPRFERFVLAEFALRERRGRRADRSHRARVLAERLHDGRDELLAHLRRVSYRVPERFRRVAWLHHAYDADATPRALRSAALSNDELAAIELFGKVCPPESARPLLPRVRALAAAPGLVGYIARVVARAGIEDRLDGARPTGDTLAALLLLPDPRRAR
jgi:hypothetical protein